MLILLWHIDQNHHARITFSGSKWLTEEFETVDFWTTQRQPPWACPMDIGKESPEGGGECPARGHRQSDGEADLPMEVKAGVLTILHPNF